MIIRFIVVLLIGFLLISCKQEELTYDYLLQHLDKLKDEVSVCQKLTETNTKLTEEQEKRCELVMYTAANVISLLNEQRENEQQFGKKVLAAESEYVKAKEDLAVKQANLNKLNNNQADSAKIKLAEAEVKMAQETYQKHDNELKLLLAVLSLSGPE